jgi:hypothetical protein
MRRLSSSGTENLDKDFPSRPAKPAASIQALSAPAGGCSTVSFLGHRPVGPRQPVKKEFDHITAVGTLKAISLTGLPNHSAAKDFTEL